MEKKLVLAVLEWWKNHEDDAISDSDGDEYNVYTDTPEFVTLAKKIKESW